MKTYSIALFIAALALGLGGCSSAYRSAQTPDAVYYSPTQESGGYAASNSDQTVAAVADNGDGGQYVTYDNDGYSSGYADDYDGYYTQRINMFDRPGSFYAFNNYYMGGLGYYGSPYYSGLGWNPFMWSYPSLSLGWTLGSPWGGWYRPMYAFGGLYHPYYSSYNPYYPGYYYGGGYGYGHGSVIDVTPRPAVSYGPRRTAGSRAANAGSERTVRTGEATHAPRRTFRTGNSNTNATHTPSNTRRVFRTKPDEHPVNVNTNTRTEQEKPRRIFRRSNTTEQRSNTNTQRTNTQPVRTYRPAETRTVQPTRSFESNRSSTPSRSAPARTFSPRGR